MTTVTDHEPRTYRGSTLEELLPKIREELGPDAIIVRQREGLDGGLGGFFQRRCVEVVARRPGPGVDAYDSPAPAAPAAPAAPRAAPAPEPAAPAIREIMRVASPFIDQLHAAEVAATPLAEPPAPVTEAGDERWQGADGRLGAEEEPAAEPGAGAHEEPAAEQGPGAEEEPEAEPGAGAHEEPAAEQGPGAEEEPEAEPGAGAHEEPAAEQGPGAEEEPEPEQEPGAEEQPGAAEQPGAQDEPDHPQQPRAEDPGPGSDQQPGSDQPVTGAFGTSAYTMTAGGAMVSTRQSAAPLTPAPAAPLTPAPAAPLTPAPGVPPAPALQLVTQEASAVTPFDPGALECIHASVPELEAEELDPEPEPEPEPAPATRTDEAAAHERALAASGIAPALAADLVDATISHILPFGPKRALKRALRKALARRIPIAPPFASGGHAIAFVGAGGSGKTLCAARLATAYAQHSDLGVTVMSLAPPERAAALRAVLDPAGVYVLDARSLAVNHVSGDRVLTIIDTPPLSPAATDEIHRLAGELRRLGAPAVHLAVPATLSSAAVRALLDGFAPLAPAAIAITHLDEVGHAGPVIDEAIARGLPISYTSDGSGTDAFAPADAAALAAGVLA